MLSLSGIYKQYENKPLLRGIDFEVAAGETVCLLGRSGSGKSTILRIIAGIETAEAGSVAWSGEDLSAVPVHKRQFGFMFQDYALFPHLTVYENIAFGLKMQGIEKEKMNERVNSALEQINMVSFKQRSVAELSGGEQQRVALARALAPQPRLLMLDEPLGALDRTLREQLMQELRDVLHQSQIPAIYVTHDQEEAFTIGDRLILLNHGKIVQNDTPQAVYEKPKNAWVAKFLGLTNIIDGVVLKSETLQIETSIGKINAAPAKQQKQFKKGQAVSVLLRPQAAALSTEKTEAENQIQVVVEDCVFLGDVFRIRVRAKNNACFDFLLEEETEIGKEIRLTLDPEEITCLER